MRIHTDKLTLLHIREAVDAAGDAVRVEVTRHNSRSRARAFNVLLSGSSSRRNYAGDDQAATWDEWGIFLARLFDIDPDAHAQHYRGGEGYTAREFYHWATGGRFLDGATPTVCSPAGHRWEHVGAVVTGTYHVYECQRDDCTALHRTMAAGHKFSELV